MSLNQSLPQVCLKIKLTQTIFLYLRDCSVDGNNEELLRTLLSLISAFKYSEGQ